MLTTPLLALLLACQTDPASLSSEPAEPTVDLKQEEKSVTWATLTGLLAAGEPTIPEALGGVFLGQPVDEARLAFVAVRHKKLQAPAEKQMGEVLVIGGRLQEFPTVGATLIVRDGVVEMIDMSLPRDEALFLATEAWGPPDSSTVAAAGVPQPVWRHDGLVVTLIDTEEKQAILKFAAED